MANNGLIVHLARFAGVLRDHGIGVGIGDELDATRALTLIDLFDAAEVRRAFQIAFKIRPRDREVFDALFSRFWSAAEPDWRIRDSVPVRRASGALPRGNAKDDDDRVIAGDDPRRPAADRGAPGYTSDVVLRRKPFEECSARDLADMERLLARLAPRWASRKSRRLTPVRGRGLADLRRSFRRAVSTGGEMVSLARRARALDEPRVVVLCDTSGSMDVHVKFLLAFVLALKQVARTTEVFAFNTSLTRLTPWLSPGKIGRTIERLAADVPGWSGGTRIGESLMEFVEKYEQQFVTPRSVVVILSDGLDRGDTTMVAGAMRAIRSKARRIVWLNPLSGDRGTNRRPGPCRRHCPSSIASPLRTTSNRSNGSSRSWRLVLRFLITVTYMATESLSHKAEHARKTPATAERRSIRRRWPAPQASRPAGPGSGDEPVENRGFGSSHEPGPVARAAWRRPSNRGARCSVARWLKIRRHISEMEYLAMAMEISKSFVVKASREAAWNFLTDPVRVARCLPGAAITGQVDERTHAGTITMKVGPVAASYKGTMRFERLDTAAWTAEIVAAGQDVRGKGGADLRMSSTLVERAPGETEVSITSQVNVMGILAQFGRGMIQDVSDQMFATFVAAVRAELEMPENQPGSPTAAVDRERTAPIAETQDETPSEGTAPIEVLSFGSAVVGRAAGRTVAKPAVWIGGIVLLVILYWFWRG